MLLQDHRKLAIDLWREGSICRMPWHCASCRGTEKSAEHGLCVDHFAVEMIVRSAMPALTPWLDACHIDASNQLNSSLLQSNKCVRHKQSQSIDSHPPAVNKKSILVHSYHLMSCAMLTDNDGVEAGTADNHKNGEAPLHVICWANIIACGLSVHGWQPPKGQT
eukprot:1154426-Pelagomonas_calceolata.AAC.3